MLSIDVPKLKERPLIKTGTTVLLGPSKCGKSTLACVMIMRQLGDFDNIFVFSRVRKTLDNWYRFFKKNNRQALCVSDSKLEQVMEEVEEEHAATRAKSLFILDDFGGGAGKTEVKNSKFFHQLCIAGRHFGISALLLAHDPVDLSRKSLSNCETVIVFKVNDLNMFEQHIVPKVLNSTMLQFGEVMMNGSKSRRNRLFQDAVMNLQKYECLVRFECDGDFLLYKYKANLR